VRILAAGGVFLSHIPRPQFLPEPVKTFIGSGYNGVTLFFILSGFVLAWSYADRILPLEPRGLWSFFVARLARVYPMYLLALLVVILPRIMDGKSDSLMLVHALALQPWMPNVGSVYVYNVPGWSIGVEFFLYACFPLLILGLSKLRKNTARCWSPGLWSSPLCSH
jgi:peptidoglycan/LPS O-acetylase OafA/YrhL